MELRGTLPDERRRIKVKKSAVDGAANSILFSSLDPHTPLPPLAGIARICGHRSSQYSEKGTCGGRWLPCVASVTP